MKNIIILFGLLIITTSVEGQRNCEAYKYLGDTLKYNACKKTEELAGHYQFSKEFQQILDESLNIDPTYDYAWRAKSVAYLKSGDFLMWKKLIDQAVEHDPLANLGYRGWCRYQFFRDYEGAIADIERLDSLTDQDIGYSANGDYHLHVARAICYKALGDKPKAIKIIEKQLDADKFFVGNYDYIHLGVLYLETGDIKKAMESLEKQKEINDLAENNYYMALAFKSLGKNKEHHNSLTKAKQLYEEGRIMFDAYTHPYDKIYLKEILEEIEQSEKL